MTHYSVHNRIYNIKSDAVESKQSENENPDSPNLKNCVGNSTSLSGLAHYNSDSEHEEVSTREVKLDSKVDDFLEEINQMYPNAENVLAKCAWQECIDKTTSYPYYWNVETNEVTWEIPAEYKEWLVQKALVESREKAEKEEQQQQPQQQEKPESTELLKKKQTKTVTKIRKSNPKRLITRKPPSSDSEDERIVMITSFSDNSSSESDSAENQKVIVDPPVISGPSNSTDVNKKEIIENVKEQKIDEVVILSRLRTQAKVLQELGELPKTIDKPVISVQNKSETESLSLVAGYGDSEPEDDAPLFPIPVTNESQLFPITKTIDVKQFEVGNKQLFPIESETETLDNKVFKRKKRLDVAFEVKGEKVLKVDEERKGFGFVLQPDEEKAEKVGIKANCIAFVKAAVLNPVDDDQKTKESVLEEEVSTDEFQEMLNVVNEKVNFLCEGKNPISAVQIMAIQLQTLESAFKEGGLSRSYLYNWLRDTFTELGKLEADAVPDGWNCQWDRALKRYCYRHVTSGETQWHYPEVATGSGSGDIVGGSEAMDISTTPPPPPVDEELVAPPPPKLKCPESPPPPPPPPLISQMETGNDQPPIPPLPPSEPVPPPPPIISLSDCQPLPPGVDSPENPFSLTNATESSSKCDRDSMGSELDSFYSDIAKLEATNCGEEAEIVQTETSNVIVATENSGNEKGVIKKKKKSKSKLGQGINMKKKAVSSLVEKWKKVQNDYL